MYSVLVGRSMGLLGGVPTKMPVIRVLCGAPFPWQTYIRCVDYGQRVEEV